MASTYSPKLKFELIGAGEQAGLWGTTTNKNIGELIEQAIAGVTTVDLTSISGNYTLTSLDGTVDQARSAVISCIGTAAGAVTVIIPTSTKLYVFRNACGFAITIKTAGQIGGVILASGEANSVFCDGASAYPGLVTAGSGTTPVGQGGTGVTGFTGGFVVSPAPFGSTALTSISAVNLSNMVTGQLGVANGGTGISTTPTAGSLLIGTSGGGYAVGSLTAGTGITVTPSSGGITISTSGASGVSSFNGRTGTVTPLSSDYSAYYATTSAPTFSSYITTPRVYYGTSPGSMSVFDNGGEMQFQVGGVNAAKVTSSGIGCGGLQALGAIESVGGYVTSNAGGFSRLGDNSVFMYNASCNMYNNGSAFGWSWAANTIAALYNNGSNYNLTGIYGTISDERVKENITPARSYLSDLCKLEVIKYSLKKEESTVPTKLGFVAQQVQKIMPGLVDEHDYTEEEGISDFKSVKTSIMIPMLVQAVQELKAGLDAANAEIAALKGAK